MLILPGPVQPEEALSGAALGLPGPSWSEEALVEAGLRAKTCAAGGGSGGWGFRPRTPAGLPGPEHPGETLATFPSDLPIP